MFVLFSKYEIMLRDMGKIVKLVIREYIILAEGQKLALIPDSLKTVLLASCTIFLVKLIYHVLIRFAFYFNGK